jgi:hypothetical protein
MFTEFASQVWTTSATGVTITNNTDISVDGSSKKIVWTEANKTATLTFTSVTLSAFEEISMQLYIQDTLYSDLFTMTVGGTTLTFNKRDFQKRLWNHVLIDCTNMTTPATTIVITSLVPNLILFFDYAGYRKVTYNSDVDIITALKDHISLDYGTATTLSASAAIGDTSIAIINSGIEGYINETSILEIDNGAGTIEEVELIDREGTLKEGLVNAFSSGDAVRVICPVRSEDYDDLQPDPICGIKVYDLKVDKQRTVVKTKNGSKIKECLGELGVLIYIDCKSKKKLLQMAREYNKKYGEQFQFLLDGEQVDIYMESSAFVDDVIGNNPRMAYYYLIEPQPYLLLNPPALTTITLATEVKAVEDVV